MIGRLSGTIVEKDLRALTVDAGGVGYEVLMPLTDLGKAGALGDKVVLRIHTHVREDAIQLFGFLHDDGRNTFTTLMTVNGVGPKLALGILSGIEPGDLASAVNGKDLTRLTAIPGIGKKTAERLCLELAGKLGAGTNNVTTGGAPSNQMLKDLSSALLNLGYRPPQVDKVSRALDAAARGGAPMDALIRDALKLLASGTPEK